MKLSVLAPAAVLIGVIALGAFFAADGLTVLGEFLGNPQAASDSEEPVVGPSSFVWLSLGIAAAAFIAALVGTLAQALELTVRKL